MYAAHFRLVICYDQILTHLRQNATKVMWSMNHIMREDARRRFVIGFSIDDCDMRLWYFSRSDAYVSEPFNFLTVRRITYVIG